MADNYYNYNNLETYVNKLGLYYDGRWLRWVKDIINTKIIMFRYDNLPGKLTSEIMEKALMFNNFLCGWVSGAGEFYICRYRFGSVFDEYWKPVFVDLLTLSGKPLAYHVPYSEIVLFRDNPMDIIPFLTLNSYIENIISKEKTLDSIFDWLSLPAVFAGDATQAQTLKTMIKKATDREPFVVASKNFKDHLEQFDLRLPVELEQVYDIMKKYRAMAMASMGIYQVDEKRERIVTSEIQAQNDYVDFVYTGMYNERRRFVEEVNEKFGLNIELIEVYVENQDDNIDIQKRASEASKAGDVLVQKEENKGKVEVEKLKEEGNNGSDA